MAEQQHKALKLADWLFLETVAELHRLHAENEALRKERDEMLLLLADPPSPRSKE